MTNLWCQNCGRGMEGIPALLRHQVAVHGRGPVLLEPEEPEYVVVDLATHCQRGHPFSPENTYVYPNGRKRQCRTCARLRAWAQYHSEVVQ